MIMTVMVIGYVKSTFTASVLNSDLELLFKFFSSLVLNNFINFFLVGTSKFNSVGLCSLIVWYQSSWSTFKKIIISINHIFTLSPTYLPSKCIKKRNHLLIQKRFGSSHTMAQYSIPKELYHFPQLTVSPLTSYKLFTFSEYWSDLFVMENDIFL